MSERDVGRPRRLPTGAGRWLAAASALAFAAMLWLAGRTVVGIVLLIMAVVFLMLVALAAAATVWFSSTEAPGYLRDTTGALLPFGRRVVALVSEGVRRVRGRPWRTPEQIWDCVARRANLLAWNSPSGWISYSDLRVELHPDTLARLEGWMPLQDAVSRWVAGYARQRRRTARLDDQVRLVLVADARLPDGLCRVTGSFQPDRSGAAIAAASAALVGPPAADRQADPTSAPVPRDDGFLPAPATVAQQTEVWPSTRTGGRGDDTVELAGTQSGAAQEGHPVAPGPTSDPLVLRRCEDGGHDVHGQPELRIVGPQAVLGRDPGCDVRIDEPHVSRSHARLTVAAGRWAIEDLGSSQGTLLNGSPIAPQTPQPLAAGDTIRLARSDPAVLFRVVAP